MGYDKHVERLQRADWRKQFEKTIILLTQVCDELDRVAVTTTDENLARTARAHYVSVSEKITGIKRRILKEEGQWNS